jgi:hypothetical protein
LCPGGGRFILVVLGFVTGRSADCSLRLLGLCTILAAGDLAKWEGLSPFLFVFAKVGCRCALRRSRDEKKPGELLPRAFLE